MTETGERLGEVSGAVLSAPEIRDPIPAPYTPAPPVIEYPTVPEYVSPDPYSPTNDNPINVNVSLPGSATTVTMPSPGGTSQKSFLEALGISPTVALLIGGAILVLLFMRKGR